MNTFFIWSNEHKGWWRPGRCGYTENIKEAGQYPLWDAWQICVDASYGSRDGLPEESMVPCTMATTLTLSREKI